MSSQIQDFASSLQSPDYQSGPIIDLLKGNQDLTAFLGGETYNLLSLVLLACQILKHILGQDVVDTSPASGTTIKESWSQSCWLTPSCIVVPRSSHDVSATLKTIKFFGIKFAVRSGGHSPNPGWSTLNGPGILIDLQQLNQITVSDDRKSVVLGPGGRWGDVYQALDPYDVAVVGGRIPHVGVAGAILGGGLFHFSGEYGLAADNVQKFEVVLADGTIVDACADNNSDLFWALKGGGANFGIVTRFDMSTIPVKNIWFQLGIYTADQVPTILEAFAEWQKNGASDLKSTVTLVVGLETTSVGLLYSVPAEKPEAFAPFYDIPAALIAVPPTNGTINGLTQLIGSTSSNVPQRHDYRGASSKVDAQLYKDAYEFWKKEATAAREATGANMTFVLQPIPANVAKVGIANGGNPLGLLEENHQWWTTLVDWNDAIHDETVRAAPIRMTEFWKEQSEARGLQVPFLFMNDASRDQNPLSGYGEENVQRLKEIAAKYDPTQVFQKLQNGGFLLSRI
ncbi:putative 6-hydroxy-D-nicotine oxidase [Massariosphaeria phaeospora]|uniref:Putative 6-hydroxy-D-nicotine oxidase n=1 Tax=Massariosphaeria phaeospora TaxID=100035 RepID=A0A7C8IJ84_9PLEO|nr:putative 6-hydroxy-D-nicotine oxidase [Massariosphaeria phaeospora]